MTRPPSRRRAPSQPSRSSLALHAAPAVGAAEDRLWTRAAWGLAAVFAAVLLALALGPHRIGDYFTETDFYGAYADGARLVQRGVLDPSRYGVVGPVYEITLGLVGFVVRDLFLAAELLSVVSATATVLLWFQLLRRRLDARVGLLAALFMVTNAWFLRFGYAAATDATALAFQAWALWLLLAPGAEAPDGPGAGDGARLSRAAFLAGLVSAIAFLTRYNAVYLLPAGLVMIALGAAGGERRARRALLFAAGFLAPVAPWVLYSLSHGGGFSFQLHHNIAYEVFARAKGIAWDDYQRTMQSQFPTLGSVIARDPGAVAARMFLNVGDHLAKDASKLLGWPVAVCALAGIGFGFRDGSLRRSWPVLAAAALLFLTLVPVFHSERYSLALLPAYAMLAAMAFASPLLAIVAGGGRWWLKPLVALLPLALAAQASWRHQAHAIGQLPVEVLESADALRSLAAPGDKVIARKGHIGFHAGLEVVGFPFADDLGALADYAREAGARWLFFSWPEAETRPKLWFLLDTTADVPGLTVRHSTSPRPAVLYEIGPRFGGTPSWFANDTLRSWHDARARLLVDAADPALLQRFAQLSWALGKPREASGALDLAARLEPSNAAVFLMLGRVRVELGDLAGAEQAFRRAEELDPSNPDARVGRGLAVLLSGRAREAADLWRPVVGRTGNPRVLQQMISLYESLGDRASADAARRALAGGTGAP